jgi:hypothetical protein
MDRDQVVREGYGLIAAVATLEGLDPGEVLARASEYRGGVRVSLESASDARLLATMNRLRQWHARVTSAPVPAGFSANDEQRRKTVADRIREDQERFRAGAQAIARKAEEA